MIYVGIDPGANGGMAWTAGGIIRAHPFRASKYVLDMFRLWKHRDDDLTIVLEEVHSFPRDGVRSAFSFGANFGWWRGVIESMEWQYTMVKPQDWQRHLGCMTKGDKNVTKRYATELVKSAGGVIKVTHTIADAICLAEYARRTA